MFFFEKKNQKTFAPWCNWPNYELPLPNWPYPLQRPQYAKVFCGAFLQKSDHFLMDFDMQAAWLRRFSSDAQSNLGAFALRLREAMPDLVTVHEQKGLFSKSGKITGVTVELGERRYKLEIAQGRLVATIGMVVRGITLSTKTVAPSDWFAALTEETQKASAHAQSLSASLQQFMAS